MTGRVIVIALTAFTAVHAAAQTSQSRSTTVTFDTDAKGGPPSQFEAVVGDWYVADSSSIGLAVLATSVRCQGAERERYLASAEKFANLVISN